MAGFLRLACPCDRFLFLVLGVLTIANVFAGGSNLELTLLHTANVQSRVLAIDDHSGNCEPSESERCLGGVARRATFIDQVRAERTNVLLLDAGGLLQGSLFYLEYKHEALKQYYNWMGYDVFNLGTREFFDPPNVVGDFLEGSSFQAISCNLNVEDEPALKGKVIPFHLLNYTDEGGGQVMVGVTGFVSELLPSKVANIGGIKVADPINSLRSAVAQMQDLGVRCIIAVVGDATLVKEVVDTVHGIDVLVSDAQVLYSNNDDDLETSYPESRKGPSGTDVPIVASGILGTHIGMLNITFSELGVVLSATGDSIALNVTTEQRSDFVNDIEARLVEIEQSFDRVVGRATAEIGYSLEECRTLQCAMGTFGADALRAAGGTQFGFINGGSIRAPFPAGNITLGDVLNAFPFSSTDTLSTFQLTGLQMVEMLENGVSRAEDLTNEGTGRLLQVSGFTYSYNPNEPVGRRIVSVSIPGDSTAQKRQDGSAATSYVSVDLDAVYSFATVSFIRTGGDNFTVLEDNARNVDDFGPSIDRVMLDHVAANFPLVPNEEERVSLSDGTRTLFPGATTVDEDEESTDEALVIGLSVLAGVTGVLILAVVALAIAFVFYRGKRQRTGKTRLNLKEPEYEQLIYAQSSFKEEDLRGNSSGDVQGVELGSIRAVALQKFVMEKAGLEALLSVANQNEVSLLAESLCYIYTTHARGAFLTFYLLNRAVQDSQEEGVILREDSMGTASFKIFARLCGLPYLWKTFAHILAELASRDEEEEEEDGENLLSLHTKEMEVNPQLLEEGLDFKGVELTNKLQLQLVVQKMFLRIMRTSSDFPAPLRDICRELRRVVEHDYADSWRQVVGSLIFLRFLTPALILPHHYGLLNEAPSPTIQRLLILISKVLQNLSNGVHFGEKEDYMASMNDFIDANGERLDSFLSELTKPKLSSSSSASSIFSSPSARAIANSTAEPPRRSSIITSSAPSVLNSSTSGSSPEELEAAKLVPETVASNALLYLDEFIQLHAMSILTHLQQSSETDNTECVDCLSFLVDLSPRDINEQLANDKTVTSGAATIRRFFDQNRRKNRVFSFSSPAMDAANSEDDEDGITKDSDDEDHVLSSSEEEQTEKKEQSKPKKEGKKTRKTQKQQKRQSVSLLKSLTNNK